MKQACISVGPAVWTLTYTDHGDGTATILNFESDGNMFQSTLPVLNSIQEQDGRIADKITVDGVTYDVRNKQYIFAYKQPL